MDLLQKMLDLLESYLLMDAQGITLVSFALQANLSSYPQTCGTALCSTLAKAMTTSKQNSDSTRRILTTLSLLVRTAPLSHLAHSLIDASIFQNIIAALEDDKASGQILAAYLEVLSRIALIDPHVFLQMVTETALRQGRDGTKVLDEVLDAMWRDFDYVGDARTR